MVFLIELSVVKEGTLPSIRKVQPILDSAAFLQTIQRCSFDGSEEAATKAYDAYHAVVSDLQKKFVKSDDAVFEDGLGPYGNRHFVDDNEVSGSYYYYGG